MRSDGVAYHQSNDPRTCGPFQVGMLPRTWWAIRVHFFNLSQMICSAVLSWYWCVYKGFKRLSICLRIYRLVEYIAIKILAPYVSFARPTATLHHIFNFLYDTWLHKICKSMSRRIWITHLVSKEVHSMKEDVQLPNSLPVILFPQHRHAIDRQLYSKAFPLYSLAFPSSQHKHSVRT